MSKPNRSCLRFVYFTPFDLRLPSGHTSHVLATITQMVRKGHEVTLIATGCPEEVAHTLKFVQLNVIDRRYMRSVSFGVYGAAVLARIIRQGNSDVVYARYFKSVLIPVITARTLGVPVVLEVNASLANERALSGQNRIAALAEKSEQRAVLRLAGAIIAVSPSIAEEIAIVAPRQNHRVRVIENGVNTSIFYPRPRSECAARHGLVTERKRIVFSGSFQKWQGLPDLVAAFASLAEHMPLVDLLLVGDGPLREEIEQTIEDRGLIGRVRICGFVAEDIVAELLCASDVAVAPYNLSAAVDDPIYGARMRGSPLKIFTYLACGLPVVASHFREAGAYVQEAGVGKSALPGDPLDLASSISEILKHPSEARAMGLRGQHLAREHDWSKIVDKYIEVSATVVFDG